MNTTQSRPVVVAVDGSAGSSGALRYAVLEADCRETSLRIVHVLPVVTPSAPMHPIVPADLAPSGRLVLKRATEEVRAIDPDLPVTTELTQGARAAGIAAAAHDAQLLVVGRETRRGLERLLTGATTAGVAARARCPVVVVADDWQPRKAEAHRQVVVGLHSALHATELLTPAFEWASETGARLTAVYAWELPDPYVDRSEYLKNADKWEQQGLDILEEALASWRREYPDVQVETRVVHGQAASVLLRVAEDADLLILRRAHEHRPFDHLGSTVRALLLASTTPVMVVPTGHDHYGEPGLVIERSGELVR